MCGAGFGQLRGCGMEAGARHSERLPAMRVLAEIGEQVQSRIERHVFVPILTNVNLMVTAMTSGSGTIAVVAATDGVLPSKRAGICTAGYKIDVGCEERGSRCSCGRHREVCGVCCEVQLSGT